ncbi:MAG: response regulator, partial [Desulfobacterales bacterium]|nr:response regulator [Desulfobacterales bacterium]
MKRNKILIVDDEPNNLQVLRQILKQEYELMFAKSGLKAIELAERYPPDLILLDIMMPEMDGYDVCRLLKSNPRLNRIPVIFVTALIETEDEEMGLNLGAVDYIAKPVSAPIVKARLRTHLDLYDQNRVLEKTVTARTRELSLTQDATIFSLATLAEYRDNETGGHILRTKGYVNALANRLHEEGPYSQHFTDEIIDLITKSAPLHDIGKVGVPDALLLKPGKLTED